MQKSVKLKKPCQKRLFVAIPLPNKLKRQIFFVLKNISRKKWSVVPEKNLHITLCFVGYTPEQKQKEIEKKLGSLSCQKRFEVQLEGYGKFNNRIVWLGISRGEEEVERIAEKACSSCGIPFRKFHGHITLCRNKQHKGNASELCTTLKKKNKKWAFMADKIVLMESVLKQKGPVYSVIKKVYLG